MNILLMWEGMQITVKNNKVLTAIVEMIDGTPLRWHVISDVRVAVIGERALLYELLWRLTAKYLCTIEII